MKSGVFFDTSMSIRSSRMKSIALCDFGPIQYTLAHRPQLQKSSAARFTFAGMRGCAATSSALSFLSTSPLHFAHRVKSLPRWNVKPKRAATKRSWSFGSSGSTTKTPTSRNSRRRNTRRSRVRTTRCSFVARSNSAPYSPAAPAGTCSASTPRARSQRARRPREPSATKRLRSEDGGSGSVPGTSAVVVVVVVVVFPGSASASTSARVASASACAGHRNTRSGAPAPG
mmetsp:Transcript_5646/g.22869  ORF Transcript_5646/g.22869 Transcript_5646/m.22869 type:complete len:229 (-) Transcript_5646:1986-2672(-)